MNNLINLILALYPIFINKITNKMKSKRANDSNFILRSLFIHCYIHIYQIITTADPTNVFRAPRFELFDKIKYKFTKGSNKLFQNILVTYKWHIVRGAVMTCIFVFFNLLMPELLRMFMHFMHGNHTEKNQVKEASVFIRNLVGVQVLRVVFGEHTRRIFHELAIKTESSLAKMLIRKSLNLSQKAKRDIPYSELLQLENVDLKLVFAMMNNMMFVFEAPLTVVVALIMLFVQSRTYGFIGVYWFLIAFLLHRELDQRMTHCNATKLGLIDKRSKINYEMLFGMTNARIAGWEDVIIEKNNDLFEQQNHDHQLFYFFNSLYDIILLLLPVLVVVTIGIWDANQSKHIKVEQVYLMLSLLGICYQPMKSFRTISISFHDGLHSLHRLQQFFEMPEEKVDITFINQNVDPGYVIIEKNTTASYPGSILDFFIKTDYDMQIKPSERFVILGRKGQGRTAFLSMINGYMKKIQGKVRMNGKKACALQNFFFIKTSVKDNIIFYNEQFSQAQVDKISQQLSIFEQLKNRGGLNTIMDDLNKFSKSLLQRISLARVLCSNAQIYILDRPFEYLEDRFQRRVDKLLREKQTRQKVTIIMSMGELSYEQAEDKIAIIQNGVIKQFGFYQQLLNIPSSKITNYIHSKEQKQFLMSPLRQRGAMQSPVKNKFQQAVRKITTLNNMLKTTQPFLKPKPSQKQKRNKEIQMMKGSLFSNPLIMMRNSSLIYKQEPIIENVQTTWSMLKKFIFAVPIIEILFIMLIIACAELMHVFIHYFIGHEMQQHGDSGYHKMRKMMIIQVILTMGLAGVLFYEGQVSSQIAIIQGHKMYKNSLFSLINKKLSFFKSQYSVKIADRFNHDYEEVFIACHGLLNIYKNSIILITTVFFISSDGYTVLIFFSVIILLYAAIYAVFRLVQKKVVAYYYDYKYGFVKCYQESLEGSEYFDLYDKKNQFVKRAQAKYRSFASYKLAQKNTNHGLTIACDLMGNILLASIVYYGLQAKVHHSRSNIALIATSIHLLMNGSQVLKNILKETINFQTFFRINLVPFLQVATDRKNYFLDPKNCDKPTGFVIKFDSAVLQEPGQMKPRPLNLTIKQGQHILLYDTNESFRNLLLYSLTKNQASTHQQIDHKVGEVGNIFIGQADIHRIHPDRLFKLIGVILNNNFYFTGTLRENLVRKIKIDQEEVDEYIKALKIDQDIEDYDLRGLDTKIYYQNSKVNYELTKKFAVMRILLNRCKIIIIKDTTAFVGSLSIVDLLKRYIPDCTIIKISSKIESAFGVDRVVYMENSVILEEGSPSHLMTKPTSVVGNMMKDLNMDDYLFKNQCSRARISSKMRNKGPSVLKTFI